jgi:pyruvate dehydrogenase E1 component
MPMATQKRSTDDINALETQEWLDSLNDVYRLQGSRRCERLLQSLLYYSRQLDVRLSACLNTPYCNTITQDSEPTYPGDLELEQRITSIIPWNALAMVVRANRASSELGGHLASYASAADLFEVGFHHFFRGDSCNECSESKADLVFFQPHSVRIICNRLHLT